MNQLFRRDFWALAREQKGYYSWAQRNSWRLLRSIGGSRRRCPCMHDPDPQQLVDQLFGEGLGGNPLIDCVFEGLARAESRFALRFVPQRSHEERLTGALLAEMEAGLFLVREAFQALSLQLYGTTLEVDFLHYDLSRGGKIEKETGGDLAVILSIDLPDMPRQLRYAAFQAKKLDRSASIPKEQYKTLSSQFGDAAAYLFYDMSSDTGLPPMVVSATAIKRQVDADPKTNSCTILQKDIEDGLPLSLWLLTKVARGEAGISARSFQEAMNRFSDGPLHQGRMAVLSIGRPITLQTNNDNLLVVDLGPAGA